VFCVSGVETLSDYRFRYGRNPLLELPLAINPSGCARSEPKIRALATFKRPHTQRTAGTSARPAFVSTPTAAGEVACPYSKQFVHSKSSQYKKMKQEWRNNVYLARYAIWLIVFMRIVLITICTDWANSPVIVLTLLSPIASRNLSYRLQIQRRLLFGDSFCLR